MVKDIKNLIFKKECFIDQDHVVSFINDRDIILTDKNYEDLFGKRFFYRETKKFLFGLVSLIEIIEDQYPDKNQLHFVSHGRYLHTVFINIFNFQYKIEYSNNEYRSLEYLRKNNG